jgi:hypothetical protein
MIPHHNKSHHTWIKESKSFSRCATCGCTKEQQCRNYVTTSIYHDRVGNKIDQLPKCGV